VLRTLVPSPQNFIVLNDRAWDWRASQGVLTPLTEPDGDFSPWLGLVNRDHRVISRPLSGPVVVDKPTTSVVGG